MILCCQRRYHTTSRKAAQHYFIINLTVIHWSSGAYIEVWSIWGLMCIHSSSLQLIVSSNDINGSHGLAYPWHWEKLFQKMYRSTYAGQKGRLKYNSVPNNDIGFIFANKQEVSCALHTHTPFFLISWFVIFTKSLAVNSTCCQPNRDYGCLLGHS